MLAKIWLSKITVLTEFRKPFDVKQRSDARRKLSLVQSNWSWLMPVTAFGDELKLKTKWLHASVLHCSRSERILRNLILLFSKIIGFNEIQLQHAEDILYLLLICFWIFGCIWNFSLVVLSPSCKVYSKLRFSLYNFMLRFLLFARKKYFVQ